MTPIDSALPPGMTLPPGRRLALPGRGTTFIREVEGPPGAPVLFLLHGLGATGAVNWFAAFGPLSRHFRIIAIDQRGHGRGIRPGLRRFRLEDCADDVAAVADSLNVPQVIPVGYSMGGPVAQLAWHRHPERVAGLVLCATARSFGAGRADLAQFLVGTGMGATATALRLVPRPVRRQVVRAGLARRRVVDPSLRAWILTELAEHDPSALIEATRALSRYSSGRWLGEVAVPTSVVVTMQDGLVAPARQLRMAGAIPGARVFEVDGDHTVCAAQPDIFVPVLVDACLSVAARAVRGA